MYKKKIILITGCAGFIGYHLSRKILERGGSVVGLDNLNDYYELKLKEDRLRDLKLQENSELNWKFKYTFDTLVEEMVKEDCK